MTVIPMFTKLHTADFQNQGAQRLAQKYDPEGKRTIGMASRPLSFRYELTVF